MKLEENENTKNAVMSNEMIRNCKNDIAKFGFTGREYTQFLISVQAMKDEDTVYMFPNSELEQYREKYIKKNEYGIGDQFQLDKFKIKGSDYFVPRSFWDNVFGLQVN